MTNTASPGASTDAPTGYAALDPCVHCGFCLPACPTYLVTGDEADSPRGRIVLMRGLQRGELSPRDPALTAHLDSCLGCRACEPACPSGVGYGRGLEAARAQLTHARGLPPTLRRVLQLFTAPSAWRGAFGLARAVRATGLPTLFAGRGPLGWLFGMLAATAPSAARPAGRARHDGTPRARVALFRGCVMDTLYTHVHEATVRTLVANGYEIIEVDGQGCCGALHEHAGDRPDAVALARHNVAAFDDAEVDYIVVDSAGCGAFLKDYGHAVGSEAARGFAGKVRDVTELLAMAGPRPGAPLPLAVAYDAPCHLQHAQGVHEAPLAVLRAIPGLALQLLPGSDRCCGSAGIHAVFHPGMARAVLAEKLESFREATPMPTVVATGNPGCQMHIGAGVLAAGLPIAVRHPVELLDESYARAGFYEAA